MLPESKTPVSDVTVCISDSSFVHVTVAPFLIVNKEGLYASFFITMLFWLSVLVCDCDEREVENGDMHPAITSGAIIRANVIWKKCFFKVGLLRAFRITNRTAALVICVVRDKRARNVHMRSKQGEWASKPVGIG